ncbi:magnesium/cobalt transporter CorA [Rhabdobacter roseus]|uniref:Magnesium transport protein CorA n=1 Tax=Rhabdobacter roseus TaxID=1655419 RepID=A0A840TR36_9BACT|nr:magnesium/cobalt transporter CorA [Rhabdobacter roseus]MBB5286341.1 magnesium transporter [Rhabdobacter roseus]
MSRRRNRSKRKNLLTSPGTLTYVGPEIELHTHLKRVRYNEHFQEEKIIHNLTAFTEPDHPSGKQPHVTWLDVDGIHEPKVIEQVGQYYRLHPLLLEDIMNTEQKPKVEAYDDQRLFVTLKMLHLDNPNTLDLNFEHVSFVLGPRYLLSFQEERTGDIFVPVIERLKASVGKTRRHGADYLLFALMDVVVDNYFLILEKFGEQLDALEDSIISGAGQESLSELYTLKRELTFARRLIWPLRDIINQLIRDDSPLISPQVLPYFRDLYDHSMQAIETIDAYRELVASLVEVHLSTLSNRMNEVMKTLTIFSAIFMPLTFIVGVYGMNFDYMPELRARYGYFVVWGVMVAITIGLARYFKWKKWM